MIASPSASCQPGSGADATRSVLVAVADPSRLQGIVGIVERLGYRAIAAMSAGEVDTALESWHIAAMMICSDFGTPGVDAVLACHSSLPAVVIERAHDVGSTPQDLNVVVVLHQWFTLAELKDALAAAVARSRQ